MASLQSAFEELLSNIEPSSKAKAYAQNAHTPIREYLETDNLFKDRFVSSFLYGSYRRSTTILNIKDVDIVVLTNFNPHTDTPEFALQTLKEALGRYYQIPNNEELQTRSVKINEPLPDEDTEMTLDIVPAIPTGTSEDPILVPDRDLQEWKLSHPKAHLDKTTELNTDDYSGGTFVPLVKIVKWWWKYQIEERQPNNEQPKPKGFWLECLTADNFNPAADSYAQQFIELLETIVGTYPYNSGVPELTDPGLPQQTVSTSMTQEEFNFFLGVASDSLQKAKKALSESDDVQSCLSWREVFGDHFPFIDSATKSQASIALEDISHRKLPPWPQNIQYRVAITKCHAKGKHAALNLRSNAFPISDGYALTYHAETNTPAPYQVYWQVVNTGQHAQDDSSLRGGFDNPKDPAHPLQQTETSKYTGKHWIQCYIVKNGVLVASSEPFYLNVIHKQRKRFRLKR